MAKRVEAQQVIEPNVFENTIQSGVDLLTVLDNITKAQKDLLAQSQKLAVSTPLDSYENAKKVEENINNASQSVDALRIAEEKRAKTIKSLNGLADLQEKNLEELQISLDKLTKERKELTKAVKEGTKTEEQASKERAILNTRIKATSKALSDEQKKILSSLKATQELSVADKEALRLKERLAIATNAQAIGNEQLKLQIKEQNRQNKIQAVLTSDLTDKYEKQNARLNDLRKEAKGVAAQYGVNSKEAKKLRKEVNALDDQLKDIDDSLGQNVRNVGSYTRSLKKLRVTLGLITFGAGLAATVVTSLFSAFSQSREGAQTTQRVLIRFTAFLKVFFASLGNAQEGIVEVFNNTSTSLSIAGKEIQKTFLETTNVFGSNDKKIKELTESLKELRKEQEANADGGAKISKAFEDFGERVEEVIKEQEKFIKQQFQSEVAIQAQQKALIELQKTQAESINIANDDTLAFEERAKAFQAASKLNVQVAKQEQAIAQAQLDLAAQEAKVQLAGALTKKEAAKIRLSSTNDIIRALSREDIALKVSQETAQAVQDAFIALGQAQIEAANVQFETAEQRRKFISDVEERNLDILIDGFDNQKTINERIIADETQSLSKRQALLDETIKEGEESLKAQIVVIKRFAEQTINLNDSLSESEKQKLIERIKSADIESLINIRSSIELNQRIRDLKLSEIFEGRQLEVIRDRRSAVQDLTEANRDLNKSQLESNEVLTDIITQEQVLFELQQDGVKLSEELENLSDARLANEINNLRIRLATAKDGSTERLEIEQELNDALIEQQSDRLEKETEAEKKALEKRTKLITTGFDFLNKLVDKRFGERLNSIDGQLSALDKREEQLTQAAEQRAQNADEALVLESRKRAELEAERTRELKRQENAKLLLAAIETYTSEINQGKTVPEALSNTAIALEGLDALVNLVSLPSFYEGTQGTVAESLGKPMLNTAKDGYVIRVDGAEQVYNKEQVGLMGNRPTKEVVGIVQNHDRGAVQPSSFGNIQILAAINQLVSIEKNKPVHLGTDYEPIGRAIIDTVKTGNVTERRHRKTGGLWG